MLRYRQPNDCEAESDQFADNPHVEGRHVFFDSGLLSMSKPRRDRRNEQSSLAGLSRCLRVILIGTLVEPLAHETKPATLFCHIVN